MGIFKVKGVDLKTIVGEPFENSDGRTRFSLFGTKIKGFDADVDANTKKYATSWDIDAFRGKVKHNGVVAGIAPQGTRPINNSSLVKTADSFVYYIINNNGNLILSTSTSGDSAEIITPVTDADGTAVCNIAIWGAGGKGGNGTYYLIGGHYGGVGGGGGCKAFYTVTIPTNNYIKLESSVGTNNGRSKSSSSSEYQAVSVSLLSSSGVLICKVLGGYSGLTCNKKDDTDSLKSSSISTMLNGVYDGVTFTCRKFANGTAKKYNGNDGLDSTFADETSPYFGNPENVQGALLLTGNGGKGGGSGRGYGSGGGGGYGNAGNAGDNGNGSGGDAGTNGGGGGGSGSPANGANGGKGGYAGFEIFY
ncbi:MAG: hypothetical protein IJZ29_02735 [Clostridia bacterium]|nr:hypothetical protein [Clostridia bacterium]